MIPMNNNNVPLITFNKNSDNVITDNIKLYNNCYFK